MRLIVILTLAALHTAVVVLVVTAARELPAGGDIIAFSASGGATQDILLQDVSRGLVRNLEVKPAAQYPLAGTESQSVILKIWPKGVPER